MCSLSEVFRFTESHSHSCKSISELLSNIRLLYQAGMSFELNSALVIDLCTFEGGIIGAVDGVISPVDATDGVIGPVDAVDRVIVVVDTVGGTDAANGFVGVVDVVGSFDRVVGAADIVKDCILGAIG